MKKQQINLSQLAEAPQLKDYQNKPIQNYGRSLLEGMGYNQMKGIGKRKQNQLADIYILKPRPKALGLGAQCPKQQQIQKLQVGDKILITNQPHKGLTGYVNQVLDDSNCSIQLYPSKSVVKVNRNSLKKINRKEMKKINQEMKKQELTQKKKKRLKWVLPNIRVKIIDAKSQFYLRKVTISDITSQRDFQCRLETGEILTNLSEADVQTVIPKTGGTMLILKGPLKGSKAVLLERKKAKGVLTLQTMEELQIVNVDENEAAQLEQQ